MERLDGLSGLGQRPEQSRVQAAARRVDLRGRHSDLVQVDPVETSRVLAQRRVPSHPNIVDYCADFRDRALVHEIRPWEGATKIGPAATKVETFQHG